MGKRGPRPEPLAIRLAKGTDKKRPRPAEPNEVGGEMVRPEWLGPIASAVWDSTLTVLRARRTVSPAYIDFLAVYCQAHQDMHDAMDIINEEGRFVHSDKGGVYQHPAVGMYGKAIERIGKFGREFGLSPTSIRDIQANAEIPESESKKRKFAGA